MGKSAINGHFPPEGNDDGQNLQSATMIIHDLRYASPISGASLSWNQYVAFRYMTITWKVHCIYVTCCWLAVQYIT